MPIVQVEPIGSTVETKQSIGRGRVPLTDAAKRAVAGCLRYHVLDNTPPAHLSNLQN